MNETSSIGTHQSELRIYNFEPTSIMPADCGDQNAIIVIRQLFAGLFEFDPVTGAPVNLIAESMTTQDNRVWQVVLKRGFTFANAEPVTADSFIDAWNYAAYGPNHQVNGAFFERIEGFERVRTPDGAEPPAKVLSGLRKIDDYSFEITLSAPYSGLPAMLGYSAFFPMAQECLADMDGYRHRPIGNGAYRLDHWDHKAEIVLTRRADWGGPIATVDRLVYRMYPSLEAGYAGFEAGECDLMENIPSAVYSRARSRYAGNIFEQISNSFSYLGIPLYLPEFQNKYVRQALSLAIDRQRIIDELYDGQYVPAHGVISPNFPGHRTDAGRYCRYDPESARRLLEQGGGWAGGVLQLHSNVGGAHEAWLVLVAEHLRANLGIESKLRVELPFSDYFEQAKNRGYLGMFRRAWAPDYAWPESYLRPIFGVGGTANQQFYESQEFEALLSAADRAPTIGAGVSLYQQGEDRALEDMPIIPLWFQKTSIVYSNAIRTYRRNIINGTDYARLELRQTAVAAR